ncbi:hypothetical protein C0Q70_18623 [Pomacea canaliculata]|uniref:Uncharacterized protein n=1 Tax=Pomacea canaliculata TaxID=400727 RepID=A0A2T7NH10_POMCA|nr:hypothetical protein C0Q70_18623 [Pomacea canaliculata]
MRYKAEMDRRIRNCLIRMKGRIKQYGPGVCLGITSEVSASVGITSEVAVLESFPNSEWGDRRDWCLAVFMFPSEKQATLWYISEPELKQHDFLPPSDSVALFCMPLRYLPQPGNLTFNWEEMHNVRSNSFLQKEYIDKVASLYDAKGVNHGVIFVQDPGSQNQMKRFKDAWIPYSAHAYCAVHLFESPSAFYDVYHSDKGSHLRARRAEVCDTLSLLFTVNPNITG